MPRDSFSLKALLLVSAKSVEGRFYWTRLGDPQLEVVRGNLANMSLVLNGVSAARGLACDEYQIVLTGDVQSGQLAGTSRAYGDWTGRLRGIYQFGDQMRTGA
jgi:hypothetical protein